MNENEARLVYKNKITKNINLAAFIALCVLVFLSLIMSAFLLITEGEKEAAPKAMSYIFFGFCIFGIVLVSTLIGLMFIPSKEGLTILRFKAIDIVKMMIRGTMILAYIILAIGVFFLDVVDALYVLLWDQQHVHGCLRLRIVEAEHLVILIHHVGGNVVICQHAKNTICHVCLLSLMLFIA